MAAMATGLVSGARTTLESDQLKINSNDFRVQPGKKVDLADWPTVVKPFFKSKDQYRKVLEKHVEGLSSLQELHYASGRYALLLIFQGMEIDEKKD